MLPELLRRARPAALVVAEYAANGVYGLRHRSLLRSGMLPSERQRRLPGDELVPQPNWPATRAETICAPAAAVWPWLVQLGYGRGGYYGDLPWWRGERGRGPASSASVAQAQRRLVLKTRQELYEIAKRRGLPGRSKMGRDELARALGYK
jgi:hypothetical protein